jgi:hypothetical protein
MSTIQPKSSPSASRAHRTTRDLTVNQRWLLQIMSECQFGRIENLRVEGGQPVPEQQTRIVRSAQLGVNNTEPSSLSIADYELGKPARDLFAELARLGIGVAERIEFRYGEPCLIETSCGRFHDAERERQ